MEITISFFGPLRDSVGEKSLTVTLPTDATVADALERVITEHPDLDAQIYADGGEIRGQVVIAKNKLNIAQLEGVETPLNDGDALRLSPPVTGGGV